LTVTCMTAMYLSQLTHWLQLPTVDISHPTTSLCTGFLLQGSGQTRKTQPWYWLATNTKEGRKT
jgi:hypothetical protein